jgi:hypothetical protein
MKRVPAVVPFRGRTTPAGSHDGGRVQDITLYGLDEDGAVVSAEHIMVPTMEDAFALARERRQRFFRIEIWQGSVCIYRSPLEAD